MERDLEVRSQITLIIRHWYLIVLFGLLGALTGYGASHLNPPIYETSSIFAIGLNFDMTTPLSQYEEDLALGKVARVVLSDDVILKTIFIRTHRENKVSNELTIEDFKRQIRLEQKGSRWELMVFGEDPEIITILANSWAMAAEESLWEAYSHALRAKDLNRQLGLIAIKLGVLRMHDASIGQIVMRMQELEKATFELEPQLQQELKLSRGLTTFLSFEWTEEARVPMNPVTNSQGGQILAGNMLGIVMGTIVVIASQAIRNKLKKTNISS